MCAAKLCKEVIEQGCPHYTSNSLPQDESELEIDSHLYSTNFSSCATCRRRTITIQTDTGRSGRSPRFDGPLPQDPDLGPLPKPPIPKWDRQVSCSDIMENTKQRDHAQTHISFNLIMPELVKKSVMLETPTQSLKREVGINAFVAKSVGKNMSVCTHTIELKTKSTNTYETNVESKNCKRKPRNYLTRKFTLGTADFRSTQYDACRTMLIGGSRVPICRNLKTRF